MELESIECPEKGNAFLATVSTRRTSSIMPKLACHLRVGCGKKETAPGKN
jgi:hypothetical protein